MADAEKPIHRGNQAFIDEDFPATLQVSSFFTIRTAVCAPTTVVVALIRGERLLSTRCGIVFFALSTRYIDDALPEILPKAGGLRQSNAILSF